MSSSIFHLYVIVFCIFNGIVDGSMVLLLALQPQRDRKSRAYLYVETLLLLYAIATAMLNLFLLLRWDARSLYDIVVVCSLGLAFQYFSFCLEATNSWNKPHRWVLRGLMVILLLGTGMVLTGQFSDYVGLDEEGYLSATIKPITVLWIILPLFLSTVYASGLLLWAVYKKRLAISSKIAGGIVMITFALVSSIQTPVFRILGGPLITVGLLLLIRPVLRENVFDPIARLNRQLVRQTEQLQAIMRVGQVANSLLSMEVLKSRIETEVKESLGYVDAQIYLLSDLSEMPGLPDIVQTAARTNQVIRSDTLQAELAMPFTIAGTKTPDRGLIGIFYLQGQPQSVFDDETVEVIHILANQIAIAIHNARLFEETRLANEAKTRFIGYISHEIRNPVGAIFTTAQLMTEHANMYGEPLPQEYRADLQRIRIQAEHVRNLINDLLDMSQIESGAIKLNIEPVDPLPILKAVHQTWAGQVKPEVTFQADLDATLPNVCADKLRLTQILTNIVSNAVKFTERGSIILTARVEGALMRFEVIDTGRGMSDYVLGHLFQPYTQDPHKVQQPREGTGLGLTISKQFVELQGGAIRVTSKPGEGTAVSFTLPLAGRCSLGAETGE